MVKTFKLEILASDHIFYSGECDELIFPGQDGSFGILPNHQPMITCLNAGELRYRTGDQWHYAVVSDGFVEIMPSYVTLLADTVERPEEIDEKRAEAAKERRSSGRSRAFQNIITRRRLLTRLWQGLRYQASIQSIR